MGWNEPDGTALFYINLIVSILSFITGIVMVFFCLKVSHKTLAIKLLISIAASDLIYTTANFMSVFETNENDSLCRTQAIFREFSLFMSLWMITVTSIICCRSSQLVSLESQEKFFKKAVVIGLFYSVAMSCTPLYIPYVAYSNSDMICNISVNPDYPLHITQPVSFVCSQGQLFAFMFITLIFYIITIYKIKSLPEPMIKQVGGKVYRLLWYPMIPIVFEIPGLIDTIMMYTSSAPIPVYITILHMLLTHSLGFANAIVYGIQMKVLNKESEEEAGRKSTTVMKTFNNEDARLSALISENSDLTHLDNSNSVILIAER